MKKKIFGIKLNTFLTVFACLVAAVAFWLLVKYSESTDLTAAVSLLANLRGLL